MSGGDGPAKTIVTTDAVRSDERVEYWRETVSALWNSLRVEPTGEGFSGSIELSSFGDVGVAQVKAGPQVVWRSASDPLPDCLVNVQLTGVGMVRQGDRTAVLRPGDVALYDATKAYVLESPGPNEQLVLQVPRQALIDRNIYLPAVVARRASSAGSAAVLQSFVRSLMDNSGELSTGARPMLGRHAIDCIAIMLSDLQGDGALARVTRLDRQRVLSYIDANYADQALSVKGLAREFGVSTRTLQKRFAGEGETLSRRIKRTRLTRAHDALSDPLRSHQTITRIAGDHGFSHPSHFARDFRAEFGCTPREHRERLESEHLDLST